MAEDKTNEEAKKAEAEAKAKAKAEAEAKKKAEAEAKAVSYFKNSKYASLTVMSDGGDGVDPSTIKSERFVAYYDTFKGDVVRVGYLETSDKEIIKRCEADDSCEKIDKKEYETAVKELRLAPIPAA